MTITAERGAGPVRGWWRWRYPEGRREGPTPRSPPRLRARCDGRQPLRALQPLPPHGERQVLLPDLGRWSVHLRIRLGFISIGRGRSARARPRQRTWTVYLATLGISLVLSILALTTHVELWGSFDAGRYENVWHWIGQIATLHARFNGADILIAYLIYLAAASPPSA